MMEITSPRPDLPPLGARITPRYWNRPSREAKNADKNMEGIEDEGDVPLLLHYVGHNEGKEEKEINKIEIPISAKIALP